MKGEQLQELYHERKRWSVEYLGGKCYVCQGKIDPEKPFRYQKINVTRHAASPTSLMCGRIQNLKYELDQRCLVHVECQPPQPTLQTKVKSINPDVHDRVNLRHRKVLPRPEWWPPPCVRCHGFGYVIVKPGSSPTYGVTPGMKANVTEGNRSEWGSCPDCLYHPGHQWSHEEHYQKRLEDDRKKSEAR